MVNVTGRKKYCDVKSLDFAPKAVGRDVKLLQYDVISLFAGQSEVFISVNSSKNILMEAHVAMFRFCSAAVSLVLCHYASEFCICNDRGQRPGQIV